MLADTPVVTHIHATDSAEATFESYVLLILFSILKMSQLGQASVPMSYISEANIESYGATISRSIIQKQKEANSSLVLPN